MELTPDLLLEAKFAPARRGYDMNEVDDFLERCAEGLDVLLGRLKAEFDRAERAQDRVVELEAALRDAPAGRAGAGDPATVGEEPVAPPMAEAEAPARPEPAPATAPAEEPMRILIAAERTAEAAIADARADAERIRSEAESVASTTRSEAEALLARSRAEAEAEARRAGDEVRRSIEAEVLALRQDRDSLSTDVRSLRRWLDEQRARLRTAARDLQRLVDDPAALRELAVPELREDDSVGPAGSTAVAEPAVGTDRDGDEPATGEADPETSGSPSDADAPGELGTMVGDASAVAPGADDAADEGPGVGSDEVVVLDDADGEPTQAVPAVGQATVFDDAYEETSGGPAVSDQAR